MHFSESVGGIDKEVVQTAGRYRQVASGDWVLCRAAPREEWLERRVRGTRLRSVAGPAKGRALGGFRVRNVESVLER